MVSLNNQKGRRKVYNLRCLCLKKMARAAVETVGTVGQVETGVQGGGRGWMSRPQGQGVAKSCQAAGQGEEGFDLASGQG